MTLRVVHWERNAQVNLGGDNLIPKSSFFERQSDSWHLHLETKSNSIVDVVGLVHQDLLTHIHENMSRLCPDELIHWADIWLYMKIAIGQANSDELEHCAMNTLVNPPSIIQSIGPLRLKAGTRIRVTQVTSQDPDYQRLVGATGRVIAPVRGLLDKSDHDIMLGLEIDPQHRPSLGEVVNLVYGDRYEVI